MKILDEDGVLYDVETLQIAQASVEQTPGDTAEIVITVAGAVSDDADDIIVDDSGFSTISGENVQDALDSADAAIDTLETNSIDRDVLPQFKSALFTETAGAGTYTATIDIPDGATIVYAAWRTTAAWAATTTLLDLGVTGSLTEFKNDDDVDGILSKTNLPGNATGPFVTTAQDFVATLVTTGSGGTTGRTRVWVGYVEAVPSQDAVKA